MAFEVVELAPSIYHLQSGANSGLIVEGGNAILIDCGLDDDAGKRIKRTLESLKANLVTVIITHGHADHFGGAAYLRRTLPAFEVYAPAIEAGFIAYPAFEGMMLSAGALPFDQLRGKFTLAPACKVDHEIAPGTQSINGIALEIVPLAGHSPNQIGVRVGEIVFTADAFLPLATLTKYPVPFTAHIGRALATLEWLKSQEGITAAPGHGTQLKGDDLKAVIHANVVALHTVIEATRSALRDHPMNEAEATQVVCRSLGDGLASAVSYYLARATIQAALVYLYEQGQVSPVASGGLTWTVKA